MDDDKTTYTGLERPPWEDIRADDPVIVSRDGTVTVRRVYHNIRVPEWPPLVIEASVTKPPNPRRALTETLKTLREMQTYYALVDEAPDLGGDTAPTRPTPDEDEPTDDRPSAEPPAESRDGLVTDFTFSLDLSDAPESLPRFLALVAHPRLHPGKAQKWDPGSSSTVIRVRSFIGGVHVDLAQPAAHFDVPSGKESSPRNAHHATVSNPSQSDVQYEVAGWKPVP